MKASTNLFAGNRWRAASRNSTRFIFALGIRHIGETTAAVLARTLLDDRRN